MANNKKLREMSPKKYYKENFKEIVQEIQKNAREKECHYLDNI
ncbi:MAG: hypothetical protein ACFFCV_18375 [Promethearchaeota archaeon]